MDQSTSHVASRKAPWNKGKLIGQKAPLKLKDIWAIRVRLQIGKRARELALFNLAIDSKLRSCDLVKLHVRDICHGSLVAKRAIVIQQKTQRPVQFEITEQTRESVTAWIREVGLRSDDFLFPSRIHSSPHLSTRHKRKFRARGRSASAIADADRPSPAGDSNRLVFSIPDIGQRFERHIGIHLPEHRRVSAPSHQ